MCFVRALARAERFLQLYQIFSFTTEQGNKVGNTNVGKKIWTNVGGGTKVSWAPQGRVLVLQAPYKHQGGRGAWPMDTISLVS